MPPMGALIVGPCPECEEPILFFMGVCLPLDKEIIETGSPRRQRNHVLEVLIEFLGDKLDDMFGCNDEDDDEEDDDGCPCDQPCQHCPYGRPEEPKPQQANQPRKKRPEGKITDAECNQFLKQDLANLDDPSYFRAVFGKGGGDTTANA